MQKKLWDASLPGPDSLGYGCMRFPLTSDGSVDRLQAEQFIHQGLTGGITYFDTAWTYHQGESEPLLGSILSHYPRENYHIATKLPCWLVHSLEDVDYYLTQQLSRLQTPYLDAYLLHSLTRNTWRRMRQLGVLQRLSHYQQEGMIRSLGFSFHDDYTVFEEILTSYPWDFCQIQLNYMDLQHQAGERGYHLATQHRIPVVVMEPVKGGLLASLPPLLAQPLLAQDPQASLASWAMRWVASLPNVHKVLSGMSSAQQVADNLQTFSHFRPLNEAEQQAIQETQMGLRQRLKNGCTGCRYCMPCPAGVDIPKSFQLWNDMAIFQDETTVGRRWRALEPDARPDQCYRCGQCERLCPQQLPIRANLAQVTQDMNRWFSQRHTGEERKE